jgi:hypothetical protein
MQQLVYDKRLDTVKMTLYVNSLLFVHWFSEAMSSTRIVERKTTGSVFDIVARFILKLIPYARMILNRKT